MGAEAAGTVEQTILNIELRIARAQAIDEVMGLGKTVQMLAILEERKQQSKERLPSLIVVPKSLMFNWAQEIRRFTPNLTFVEYAGVERAALRDSFAKYDIILTTYGTLRRDIMMPQTTQAPNRQDARKEKADSQ